MRAGPCKAPRRASHPNEFGLHDLERSARAELKLRHKAIEYYLSQQNRTR